MFHSVSLFSQAPLARGSHALPSVLYSECYRKSPNFSVIADEVTSHGKEILAVCLRFLEIGHTNGQTKPKNMKLYSIFLLNNW